MNKAALKVIGNIARLLPKQEYQTRKKHVVRGDELEWSDEFINQKGDRYKSYLLPVQVNNEVNHKNRLKSAYKANGKEGIIKYLCDRAKPEDHDSIRLTIMSNKAL